MEEIELSAEDMEFVKGFDIVYAERWAKAERYIAALRQPGQIWVYDFSKRLEQPSNDALLPIWITPFSPTTRMMTISGNLCAARKRRAQAV